MPTRIKTNWDAAYLKLDGTSPIKIDVADVVCTMEEPKRAEDEFYVGLDFGPSPTYTIDIQLTRKQLKKIVSLCGRGNNWRRMHGKKMIRVPLKERRRHE